MRSMKKNIFAVIAILLVIVAVVLIAISGIQISPVAEEEETAEIVNTGEKDTITLWYTDDALTDYLNSAAVNYTTDSEEIRVVPVLVSGTEYLESISKASVANDGMPDLYITTNDTLEKAHLAGLANMIKVPEGTDLSKAFPQVSIDACTYEDEMIAYPLYFECAAFLYNSTYIDDWAKTTAEAEFDTAEGEAAQEEADNDEDDSLKQDNIQGQVDPEYDQKVNDRAQEILEEGFPTTLDKLLGFSDNYDAPQELEGIFEWDVMDIFYNYFFIGDAIDVGGSHGDNPDKINIYNEAAIRGLMKYQELNSFFSINTDEISYKGVMDDFIAGKVLFSIVTSDAVRTLGEAAMAGEMKYEYAFTDLPDITDGINAKSMSVTDVIAINGYSENKDRANEFAAYLCKLDAKELYERTGKVSALTNADFGEQDEYLQAFVSSYEKSEPLPKMLETSNMWVQMEMLFASVWNGSDANTGLKKLSEQMKMQITGETVTEDTIIIEVEVEEEDEIIETDTLEDNPESGE